MVVNPEIFILFGSSNLLVIQNVWALKSLEDSKRLGIQIARGFKTPETRTACRRLRAGDTLKASKLRVCRSYAFTKIARFLKLRACEQFA